jgi:hypothetical protein
MIKKQTTTTQLNGTPEVLAGRNVISNKFKSLYISK